jgi:hypothetical protein
LSYAEEFRKNLVVTLEDRVGRSGERVEPAHIDLNL